MRRYAPHGWLASPACSLLAALALLACGGNGENEAPLDPTESASRDNGAPVIRSVVLDPAQPVPGESVRVVAEVRDPDGDPVKMTYEWTLGGVSVGNGTDKLMLGNAQRGDALEVVVIASDGRDESEPSSLRARLGNQPPSVDRMRVGPGPNVTVGQPVEVMPETSDPEGDELELVYRWYLNGEEVDAAYDARFDTSGLTTGDELQAVVRANDGENESEPFHSPIIQIDNRPPRVTSRPGRSTATHGFVYQVVADDPDGDEPLRYALDEAPQGMEIDGNSGDIRWRPRSHQAGSHEIRVIVDDLRGGRVSHVFEVNVGGSSLPPAAVAP